MARKLPRKTVRLTDDLPLETLLNELRVREGDVPIAEVKARLGRPSGGADGVVWYDARGTIVRLQLWFDARGNVVGWDIR